MSKHQEEYICVFQTMFTNMQCDLIIMLCPHPKHERQTIISKHVPLYFKWHHEVLVLKSSINSKTISRHAKDWFYFNTYVLG